MLPDNIVEAAPGVFCVTGTDVNWILVCADGDVTLIDSGYPGDIAAVEASLYAVGSRPEAVAAILLTHAHVDHMGALNYFHTRYGTPVYMSQAEVGHARREFRHQATPLAVARNCRRPGVAGWAWRIVRAGGARDEAVPHATPFPGAGPLDLPGAPVPVAAVGHTRGHTAFFLPSVGVLATGDGLVTGHPTSRLAGAQLLPSMFNHCGNDEALSALSGLRQLDAGIILPGHGPVVRQPIAEAVTLAAERVRDPRYW